MIPPAKPLNYKDDGTERLATEEGIEIRLRHMPAEAAHSVLLVVLDEDEAGTSPDWAKRIGATQKIVYCEPRGVGATRWTVKNPPNFVERSHALLGRTVDTGRVWDVAAAARYLAAKQQPGRTDAKLRVSIAGRGRSSLIAAYAALLTQDIREITLVDPPASHADNEAPRLLNVLRVCDVPTALGMLAPRRLVIFGDAKDFTDTTAAYAAGSADKWLAVSDIKLLPQR